MVHGPDDQWFLHADDMCVCASHRRKLLEGSDQCMEQALVGDSPIPAPRQLSLHSERQWEGNGSSPVCKPVFDAAESHG